MALGSVDKSQDSSKKLKKKKKLADAELGASDSSGAGVVKKRKLPKVEEEQEVEKYADNEPDPEPLGKRKKSSKAVAATDADMEATPLQTQGECMGVADSLEIADISEPTRKVLKSRGITSLFEIQQKAFGPAFQGKDVVGRAKTGCGKTLAFVLPTVERIRAQSLTTELGGKRIPVFVAVAPTRELVRQIFTDVEAIGSAAGFRASCFYGGTAFGPQCDELRAGVDLLVATPGRLLDHIRRQTVNLSRCRVVVLDEADEMLSMGFQEDVDSILQALPQENLQKMLFSATLPKWVNSLVEKHLQQPVWIDVTRGDDSNATNSKITHKCVSCPPMMRGDCIGDLCKVHAGHFGKTIVFTGTKKECDELAANEKLAAIGAAVLHGDIGQNQREATMEGFRSGRIKCLVATDVAARGLDVPSVNLVVQTHPPQDLDMYVHRAGRTARGGHEGTSVTFYTIKEEYIIRLLEHKKGIKMQRMGPPQPADVVQAAAVDAVKQLDHVHQDSVDAFMEKARELIKERGADVVLAASLAALTGHARRLKGRSLLSAFEGFTAILLESERGIDNAGKGWYLLRQMLPQDIQQSCKAMTACKDGKSVIFDVPDDLVPRLLEVQLWRGCTLSVPKELPEVMERECDLGNAAWQLKEQKQQRWQKIADKKSAEKHWREENASGRGSGRGGRGGGRGGRGGPSDDGNARTSWGSGGQGFSSKGRGRGRGA